jgi:hypothetical protein
MSKVIRLEIGEEPERFFDLEEEKPSGFFERILAEKANSRIPQPGPGPPPLMDQPYRSSEGGRYRLREQIYGFFSFTIKMHTIA